MASISLLFFTNVLLLPSTLTPAASTKLFREYIGFKYNNIKFPDVPIHSGTQFHFIVAFAIDYTTSNPHNPTNGKFNIFWDSDNLSPAQVRSIKAKHNNVKVALSLGGDTVGKGSAFFNPNSECMGQLITKLKRNGVIKFASIAPFDDANVQNHYKDLWYKYKNVIDYVNFQFYAYNSSTTVSQFIKYFDEQASNYKGGKVLVSFASDGTSGGLTPARGFFTACNKLKSQGKLHGIIISSADDSKDKKNGFQYERRA